MAEATLSDGEIVSDDEAGMSPDKEVQFLSRTGQREAIAGDNGRVIPGVMAGELRRSSLPASIPDRPRNPLAMFQEKYLHSPSNTSAAGYNNNHKLNLDLVDSNESSSDDDDEARISKATRHVDAGLPQCQRSLDAIHDASTQSAAMPISTTTLRHKQKGSLWTSVLTDQTLESDMGILLVKESAFARERGVESYDYTQELPAAVTSGLGDEGMIDQQQATEENIFDDAANVEDGEDSKKRVDAAEDAEKRIRRKRRFESDMMEVCCDDEYEPSLSKRSVKDRLGPADKDRKLSCTADDPPDLVSKCIAETLNEKNHSIVERAVTALGAEKCIRLMHETLDVEGAGGLLVLNGSRRRTPGGVFLHLLKMDPQVDEAKKAEIFEKEENAAWQQEKKREHKLKRQRKRRRVARLAEAAAQKLKQEGGGAGAGGVEAASENVAEKSLPAALLGTDRVNSSDSAGGGAADGAVQIDSRHGLGGLGSAESTRCSRTQTTTIMSSETDELPTSALHPAHPAMPHHTAHTSTQHHPTTTAKKSKKKKKKTKYQHHRSSKPAPPPSSQSSAELSFEALLSAYKSKQERCEEVEVEGGEASQDGYDGSSESTTTSLSVEQDFLEISVGGGVESSAPPDDGLNTDATSSSSLQRLQNPIAGTPPAGAHHKSSPVKANTCVEDAQLLQNIIETEDMEELY